MARSTIRAYTHVFFFSFFFSSQKITSTAPPSSRSTPLCLRDRTLICQGGTRGDLRQWSYTAREVPPLSQHRVDSDEGDAGAGMARPSSENAPPVAVVRKLTHQVNVWRRGEKRAASL